MTPTILDFGTVFVGGSASQNVSVKNEGTDLLTVTSITADDGDYSVDVTGAVLAPGATQIVVVTYAPTSPGTNLATLSVASDDPDEPVMNVALEGEALEPPIIGVDPLSFAADLFTGDTDIQLMSISNTQAFHGSFAGDVCAPGAVAEMSGLVMRRDRAPVVLAT